MRFFWILPFFLLVALAFEGFGQYELLMDPRTGRPVRYAGDLAAKPNVILPKTI